MDKAWLLLPPARERVGIVMIRIARFARSATIVAVSLLTISTATPAWAVVQANGDGSGHTTAPQSDPGWGNVGVLGSASAVYLGNRWVLTANHVGTGSVTFPSGSFLARNGTAVQLKNPNDMGLSEFTDLLMFRLIADPGLPELTIASQRPARGTSVTLIGAGRDRAVNQTGWRLQTSSTGTTWTETSPAIADVLGYKTLDTKTMRWGNNLVESSGDTISNTGDDVLALTTKFESGLFTQHEAQAVPGDSGGGVFNHSLLSPGQLVGIMVANQMLNNNQPANTAVFGDLTMFADLAAYQDQIAALMEISAPPAAWQNQLDHFDIDDDGATKPLDALQVINALNQTGTRVLIDPPVGTPTSAPYLDVNGDGWLSPLDALQVINDLNPRTEALAANNFSASGAGNFGTPLPEPSSLVLAAGGLLLLGGYAWRRRHMMLASCQQGRGPRK